MPWKTTKLKFCGIAVRRRTLYILTLLFSILAVPAMTWALLAPSSNLVIRDKLLFMGAAVVVIYIALKGWLNITKNHSILYREEARIIWPSAAAVLVLATWLGSQVTVAVIEPGRYGFVLTYALSTAFMLVLLSRSFMLGLHPRRADVIRSRSARHSTHSPMPLHSDSAGGAAEVEEADEDSLDGEPAGDDSAPTDSTK